MRTPKHCPTCAFDTLSLQTIEYVVEVRWKGRLQTVTVPELRLHVCDRCGERVFTEDTDEQVQKAIEEQL